MIFKDISKWIRILLDINLMNPRLYIGDRSFDTPIEYMELFYLQEIIAKY